MEKLTLNPDSLKHYPLYFKLQTLRRMKQITQRNLAEKLGVSQRSVSLWEQGKVIPSGIALEKISRFHELPWNFFISENIRVMKLPDKRRSSLKGDD